MAYFIIGIKASNKKMWQIQPIYVLPHMEINADVFDKIMEITVKKKSFELSIYGFISTGVYSCLSQ